MQAQTEKRSEEDHESKETKQKKHRKRKEKKSKKVCKWNTFQWSIRYLECSRSHHFIEYRIPNKMSKFPHYAIFDRCCTSKPKRINWYISVNLQHNISHYAVDEIHYVVNEIVTMKSFLGVSHTTQTENLTYVSVNLQHITDKKTQKK